MLHELYAGAQNAILLEEDMTDMPVNGVFWEGEQNCEHPYNPTIADGKSLKPLWWASPSRVLWLDEG
jgi:hypothetical protein